MSFLWHFLSFSLLIISPLSDPAVVERKDVKSDDHASIAAEMQQVLDTELARWYPLVIDTARGGYYSDVNADWKLDGPQNKMIVTQARHLWTAAKAARFYQKDNTFRDIAAHGTKFLLDKMWDKEFGGFYDLVDRNGIPLTERGAIVKRLYGNAFAIYGLAAYYNTSGDTLALQAARRTFSWLEQHSYDPLHGGYFQFLSRNGTPMTSGYNGAPPKDQNSMIHFLESLTELYRVWPDSLVGARLASCLHIVRDVIAGSKGYMNLFFRSDWIPVSYRDSSVSVREAHYEYDHVSFGHDIETAYLMLEASDALGLEDDTTTLAAAKKMVDQGLVNGWDGDHGGIFDGGYFETGKERPSIVRRTKEWWAQVEALNSFLLMAQLFPQDSHAYETKFRAQWDFCKRYCIDNRRGGWYWGGADIVPEIVNSPKGTIWKAAYHTSRALMNCIRRLNNKTAEFRDKRFDPVNPDATPAARRLLDLLYSVKGKKIIAGHHNYVGRTDTYPEQVRVLTGKVPEVWGCDFINYYRQGNAQAIVDEAARRYKEGYIITLMWHAGRPQDDPPFGWKESIQGKLTDSEWRELTTPGTPLNARWIQQVDTVASYLEILQQRGVPVLWRPYHELNGVWFWWGNRKGPEGSAKLWRMMYERLVHVHHLNNLIWVWNANAPRALIADEAYAYSDFFPGLDCVDVLAADVYHHDYEQSHHDELVALAGGKPIALGEIGEVPRPDVLRRQPFWTWFMIWGDFVTTHNTPQQMRDLYSYPQLLTHKDFEGGKEAR